MNIDPDEYAAMRDEFRRPLPYRCRGGFCGAEDCQRCHPSTYHLNDEDDKTNRDTVAESEDNHG